jgi:hypothetical protein
MTPLRDYLLQAYCVPSARRHQDPSRDLPIKVDDQSGNDVSHLFCQIFVRVPERHGTAFILTMQNAPLSADGRDLIEEHGGQLTHTPFDQTVTLPLQTTSITFIRKLATVIRNTVGRGKRYANPNWKWSCIRTADSLDRLADELKAFRLQKRLPAELAGEPQRTTGG